MFGNKKVFAIVGFFVCCVAIIVLITIYQSVEEVRVSPRSIEEEMPQKTTRAAGALDDFKTSKEESQEIEDLSGIEDLIWNTVGVQDSHTLIGMEWDSRPILAEFSTSNRDRIAEILEEIPIKGKAVEPEQIKSLQELYTEMVVLYGNNNLEGLG